MARITVSEQDDYAERVRQLLDLADQPSDVFVVAGTRDIEVPDELAERFVDSLAADPPARKRAPRKTAKSAGE